jgi:hypothetical protein
VMLERYAKVAGDDGSRSSTAVMLERYADDRARSMSRSSTGLTHAL